MTMITKIAVGMLFPAIPLTIAALNFRYTSLAGLMRQLHHESNKGSGAGRQSLLLVELKVMQSRMWLVKYALFLVGLAFIANLAALYMLLHAFDHATLVAMNGTIGLLIASLVCFCIETMLSTKALTMHIAQRAS
ncbi:MAG: DUF2721 domain-containing protein [Candidatus Puniceispirillum sp.]